MKNETMSSPLPTSATRTPSAAAVAALRGRLEVALEAYEEAAMLAPDRALPLTSRGTVLARLGRIADALAGSTRGSSGRPRDEGALAGACRGLAGARAARGRRARLRCARRCPRPRRSRSDEQRRGASRPRAGRVRGPAALRHRAQDDCALSAARRCRAQGAGTGDVDPGRRRRARRGSRSPRGRWCGGRGSALASRRELRRCGHRAG